MEEQLLIKRQFEERDAAFRDLNAWSQQKQGRDGKAKGSAPPNADAKPKAAVRHGQSPAAPALHDQNDAGHANGAAAAHAATATAAAAPPGGGRPAKAAGAHTYDQYQKKWDSFDYDRAMQEASGSEDEGDAAAARPAPAAGRQAQRQRPPGGGGGGSLLESLTGKGSRPLQQAADIQAAKTVRLNGARPGAAQAPVRSGAAPSPAAAAAPELPASAPQPAAATPAAAGAATQPTSITSLSGGSPSSAQPSLAPPAAASQSGTPEGERPPGAAGGTAAAAEAWKEEGNRLFKAGDFTGALGSYNRSLKEAPTALAHANRAMALLRLHRHGEAEAAAGAALALDPRYAKAWQRRAAARRALGSFLAAAQDTEEALRLQIDNKALMKERAELLQLARQQDNLAAPQGTFRISISTVEGNSPPPGGSTPEAVAPAVGPSAPEKAAPQQSTATGASEKPPAASEPQPAASQSQPQPQPQRSPVESRQQQEAPALSGTVIEEEEPPCIHGRPAPGGAPARVSTTPASAAGAAPFLAAESSAAEGSSSGQREGIPAEASGAGEAGSGSRPPQPQQQPSSAAAPEQALPPEPASGDSGRTGAQQPAAAAARSAAAPGPAASTAERPSAGVALSAVQADRPSAGAPPAPGGAASPRSAPVPPAPAAAAVPPGGGKQPLGPGQGGGTAALPRGESGTPRRESRPPRGPGQYAAALELAERVTSRAARQPGPPRTGTEFEAVWRSLRGDAPAQRRYLRLLDPQGLPQGLPALLKESLTGPLLGSILAVLLDPRLLEGERGKDPQGVEESPRGACWELRLLEGLRAVPRFSMAVLGIGGREKRELRLAWATFAAWAGSRFGGGPERHQQQLESLQKAYGL